MTPREPLTSPSAVFKGQQKKGGVTTAELTLHVEVGEQQDLRALLEFQVGLGRNVLEL